MKLKTLFALFLGAAVLGGCQKDLNELDIPREELIPIQLGGQIDQVATSRVNDEGFCDGDGVGIYVVNYVDGVSGTLLDEGNQADNVRFVFDEANLAWTPDYPIYYYDKVTPVDIIGYYPYSNIDKVNTYPFEVAKDQSTEAANGLMGGYEASDFLWGKAANITPTSSRVTISYQHRMAGVQVELVEGEGFAGGEWAQLDKQILVSNTIRKASIDLATGVVTPTGEIPTTGIVPAKSGEQWRAVVVPQTVSAQMALLNITVDGIPYIFRKGEAFEYVAGKLHKFIIEVKKKEQSGLEFKLIGEAITAWESETITHDGTAREYVVINVPKASGTDTTSPNISALKSVFETVKIEYAKVKNLKITGEIDANDFFFMKNEMPRLTNLNLEEVKIVRGWCISNSGGNNDDTIPAYAFNYKESLQRIILPNTIHTINDGAFSHTGLVVVHIPSTVRFIGASVFNDCNELQSINLPQQLEEIGANAFAYCDKLKWTNFSLPNTLKKIGDGAFAGARGKGRFENCTLSLPDNLEELGDSSFANCDFVGELKLPNKITNIPRYCFAGNYFTGSLIIPNGVISIGEEAFAYNTFTGELIIPEGVMSIKKQAFRDAGFSGMLKLPESLTELGELAFYRTTFNGTIEIPHEISVVQRAVFGKCHNINKVILHSNIYEIEDGAFVCNQLKTIVCKAKNPPVYGLGGGGEEASFVSAYPITVEVPETSLQKYQQADGWKDLMPSVYRDFNIDNVNINALNAQFSKKTIVRAPSGTTWNVVHKPDWVTVTPTEGTGKVEVTITFDELAKGSGSRVDSLVFKPIEYDYQKVVQLNQYDSEYGDGDVITHQTATVGNGVNIVFMGDCFDAKDIASGYYKEIMDEAIGYFFAVEPYTTYKDYFNVYTVIGHSPDSGLPTTYSINQESKFGSQYAYGNDGFQFKFNDTECFEYACKVPTITKEDLNQTVVVLIENSNVYGGVTRMWYDNSAIAVCSIMRNDYPNDFRGVVQHEVGGHAFGKLADEYIYSGNFIDICDCSAGHVKEFLQGQNNGWYQNLSLKSNIYEVPWSHMIFDPQFSNSVDMYEGGYLHARGVFRSELNSCMNNNVPYFSAISREQIVKRIMEYAGEEYTFEKFKEKDNSARGPITTTASTTSVSRSTVVINNENNTSHRTPVIMGKKPMLNF
ncbi:MAG: leucine-rich repeat protein [Alistipes sp.]|nr:leucine-rich repeat protein [Alistipes sp.]